MKSLFRSIRRKLLDEGKLLRYLTYALGEIVLIIVGILFALEVNDWNEERKADAEFYLYVEQLERDVQKALENANNIRRDIRHAISDKNGALVDFLENPDKAPEDLEAFESQLKRLGRFAEPQVKVGLLGQIMEGNTEVIRRNRELTVKALDLESSLEFRLGIMQRIRDQIAAETAIIDKYRGRTTDLVPTIPFRYDYDKLSSSEEFIYAAQNLLHYMKGSSDFMEEIAEKLKEFLTELEAYK